MLILWESALNDVIFNGLNLKKSNLHNLLQLYAHNSIMEYPNSTNIYTDNLENILYQTMKPFFWYLVYFLN